ncbi:hypothetical protein HD553DRAFT_10287 [Filobasidium floriforme]|uniref:uncharacterized protein n=1 Tax=Filobasidium floriforme TaxID=5210 RepID=UPI001E8E8317|nr:uncharacterized protein HD553DRAFT_10287 [Filobasidium floriforme]KAH8090612.1 hypothetical protein HD553DRAFT_10287 [Filobasidium floriforme]
MMPIETPIPYACPSQPRDRFLYDASADNTAHNKTSIAGAQDSSVSLMEAIAAQEVCYRLFERGMRENAPSLTVLVGSHVKAKTLSALEEVEGTTRRVEKLVAKMDIDGIQNSDGDFPPSSAFIAFYLVYGGSAADKGKLIQIIIPMTHCCVGRLKETKRIQTTPKDWANAQIQCAVMDLVYRLATGGYTRGVPQPNLYLQKVVPRKGSMPVGLTGYQLNVLRQREMETGEALRCDQMTAVIDQALELGRLPHRPLPHETSIDGSRTIVQTMIAAYWAETVTYKGETMKRSKMHNLQLLPRGRPYTPTGGVYTRWRERRHRSL